MVMDVVLLARLMITSIRRSDDTHVLRQTEMQWLFYSYVIRGHYLCFPGCLCHGQNDFVALYR
jgi:hypothetical protein